MAKETKAAPQPRKHQPNLAGEHHWGDAGQLLLLFVFLLVYTIDSFWLEYSTFLNELISPYIRIPLGIVFCGLAGWLSFTGLYTVFGKHDTTARVIQETVFRFLRHPIYLGAILVYLGLLMFSLSLLAALVWIVIIYFYHFLAIYEEKLLLKKFGEEYAAYMQTVPRWMPRLRRNAP